ncbi:MAG: L-histidine N(alpha)-methyltransferase [Acidobacteria bacterium]|nr:L-histidine N(alpha)-methyltransferase [Acidobacteriota bacterium]
MGHSAMRTLLALSQSEFARDVRAGLSKDGQKELPPRYFYDSIGSVLFEAITRLPEYPLTRADAGLLREHASDILDLLACPLIVAELGSGSGSKTRWVLEALGRRQQVVYYPIDVSPAALAMCGQELGSIASVIALEHSYLDGLCEVAARRLPGQHLLLLFLGSTIGNFERSGAEDFLRQVRETMLPGDALLLGCDLVNPLRRMLLAYNDPAGVTAAFNLNLLGRINRELGADFDLRRFKHEIRYHRQARRIEMHLRSEAFQTISIPGAGITIELRDGETIWTEACHKYRAAEIPLMAGRTGFSCRAQWISKEWAFAQNLLLAV